MSSSNYRRNKAFIDQYRKELMSMVDDIREIDIRVLNQAVNEGMRYAKKNSPVITGFYRKNWRSAPAVRSKDGGITGIALWIRMEILQGTLKANREIICWKRRRTMFPKG